jgi:membrane protease YdiL (CAAX protease family)
MTLNSRAWPNHVLGALGTAGLLLLAYGNVGKLHGMGMELADWKAAAAKFWIWAAALGVAAGVAGLTIVHLAHARIRLAANWRVFLLQAALGPVLEEFLFRGYLMRLLLSTLRGWAPKGIAAAVAVLLSAAAFGAIHLLQAGTTPHDVALIGGLGILYGTIRLVSGSSATAAVAHTLYNITVSLGVAITR